MVWNDPSNKSKRDNNKWIGGILALPAGEEAFHLLLSAAALSLSERPCTRRIISLA